MGMGELDLDIFIMLAEKNHIQKESAVIEIGAQQCSSSMVYATEKLKKIGLLFGIDSLPSFHRSRSQQKVNQVEILSEEAPPTSIFWKWLKFKYISLDLDESHGSFFMDLNFDEVPAEDFCAYQIVTNYGTTEHIANQFQAFKIIHDLTDVGGIMIHNLPTQGYQNHGLINYNLKFFWMLSRSNFYQWLFMDYMSDNLYEELHPDIAAEVSKYKEDIFTRSKDYKTADSSIYVVLKKNSNLPFVAPVDINTGTKSKNGILKQRYWSIF